MECLVKGIPFNYQEFGEGKPILMVHGWPADLRLMASMFEPLFEGREGWRRIYPDLPGMGKTPAADWITNQDQMLEALLGFIDNVIPEQPFTAIGVSYGGFLLQGLIFKRHKTMEGAALIVPALDVRHVEKKRPDPIFLAPDENVLSELERDEAETIQAMATAPSREFVDWIREFAFPAFKIADHDFLEGIHSNGEFSFDANALSEPFVKPVLFLMGRQDSVTGYEDGWHIQDNFPRASYVVLDRAGHAVLFEQKALFQLLLHEWLDRVEESSRK